MKKTLLTILGLLTLVFATSCENGDKEFDDFDYQTVYFARQTPVRTITLGEDQEFPNELDNNHECELQVVIGGVWKNRNDRHVKIAVDNSLVNGLTFDAINGTSFANSGRPVMAMPREYYSLESNEVTIPAGQVRGKCKVHLNDAFFADPKSAQVTYVLPVKIVQADDSVLKNKDYTLYAITYKNPYAGMWLDTADGNTKTILSTVNMSTVSVANSQSVKIGAGVKDKEKEISLSATVDFTVGSDGKVVASTKSPDVTVTGGGTYQAHGSKVDHSKSWGDKERDLFALDYTIVYTYDDYGVKKTVTDHVQKTLVMISRANVNQDFSTK